LPLFSFELVSIESVKMQLAPSGYTVFAGFYINCFKKRKKKVKVLL